MRLRLKEDPREWRKFTWALSGALTVVTGLMIYRTRTLGAAPLVTLAVALFVCVTGSRWPRPYRPVYRLVMRVGHAIGQVMGRVLLALLFVFLLLPLGLILRLAGKDLLQLKRPRRQRTDSYWQPVRPPGPLDRLF